MTTYQDNWAKKKELDLINLRIKDKKVWLKFFSLSFCPFLIGTQSLI